MTELAERVRLFAEPLPAVLRRALHLPRATWGMIFAHAGMAVVIAGITGSTAWTEEKIVSARPGQSFEIAGYTIALDPVNEVSGPDYTATRADMRLLRDGREVAAMHPEKRFYPVENGAATGAAIRTNLLADVYAVIGDPDGTGAYVLRLYYNPLVPWIWLGAAAMALGGLVSLTDRRHRIGAPAPGAGGGCSGAGSGRRMTGGGMTRRGWIFLIPAAVFALLAAGFYVGLGIDPTVLPSPLIDQPAPDFALPPLPGAERGFSSADLAGHVSLVNIFASWCVPCRAEHPVLNALAQSKRVPIYGIDYKDKADAALAWIAELGNPYTRIGADDGRVGIDWGVYGVPETFIVDQAGRIRYKHVGPLTQADVARTILPLVARLEQ